MVIAAVLFLLGLSFNDILTKLNTEPTEMPLTEGFFIIFYFWIVFLLTAPVMTIRSFALEKFSGTYETLMTTPVGDTAGGPGEVHAARSFLRPDLAAAPASTW